MSAAHKLKEGVDTMLIDTEAASPEFSYLETEVARLVGKALKALEEKSEVSKRTKTAASRLRNGRFSWADEDGKS